MSGTRRNRWWIPSEGIARVVISADIQRYLGPDAVVKPGDGVDNNEGIPGYWITAPRTLTSEMIQDLKQDTQRWENEQREAGRRGELPNAPSYETSATYRSRQYYGPSESQHSPHPPAPAPERTRPQYENASSHYTTAPSYGGPPPASPYGGHPTYGHQPHVPRTNPNPYGNTPYTSQQQPHSNYPGYYPPTNNNPTPQYNYSHHAAPATNTYSSSTPQYSYAPAATRPPTNIPPRNTRVARQGYYIASDGNEYPIPQGGIPQ